MSGISSPCKVCAFAGRDNARRFYTTGAEDRFRRTVRRGAVEPDGIDLEAEVCVDYGLQTVVTVNDADPLIRQSAGS
jgi:hypothetical protein